MKKTRSTNPNFNEVGTLWKIKNEYNDLQILFNLYLTVHYKDKIFSVQTYELYCFFCKYSVGLNSIPTTCANKKLGQGHVYRHLSF